MENKIRSLTNSLVEYYELPLEYLMKLGSKSYKYIDGENKEFFLKVTPFNSAEKFKFLESLGIDNIIYPHLNRENEYITKQKGNVFYLTDYYKQANIIPEVKVQNMLKELSNLHNSSIIKRQLSSLSNIQVKIAFD